VSENFPVSVAQVLQVRVLSGFLLLPQDLQSSSTAGTLKLSQNRELVRSVRASQTFSR
jgi:hypothetical protein